MDFHQYYCLFRFSTKETLAKDNNKSSYYFFDPNMDIALELLKSIG